MRSRAAAASERCSQPGTGQYAGASTSCWSGSFSPLACMSKRSPSSTSSSEARAGSDVAKLLGRVALLAALVLGSMAFLYFGPVPYKHQLAMLIDKRVMLDATPAPRVILVGGSNLMFGVDSALLEQSLGVPVVNMGIFGGLGLLAPLDVILPHVQPADTVVLVPEYTMLFTGLAPFA